MDDSLFHPVGEPKSTAALVPCGVRGTAAEGIRVYVQGDVILGRLPPLLQLACAATRIHGHPAPPIPTTRRAPCWLLAPCRWGTDLTCVLVSPRFARRANDGLSRRTRQEIPLAIGPGGRMLHLSE
jgi:hypothetical protein